MRVFFRLSVILIVSMLVSCKGKDAIAYLKSKDQQEQEVLPIQKKYGRIIDVEPEKIKNIPLYKFIDSWMGTPYKMGGENKRGIDCSFFTQFLYHDVYGNLIERTAEKQYMAPSTDKFIGQEFLRQGDLLFFNHKGSEYHPITHVGVYLGNDYFVHSTSNLSASGDNGVQISNFTDKRWQRMFVAAGRKPKNTNHKLN
ncbi:C40 family peptidase [Aquimarina aquimarini]|uniref:C40 family peptidase n=1 Tax=Aquimarina aquimarini TaxID=1191734 RepID=UPI000D5601A6|nr:NlpC/P60 family protein [Aquimarina aquimarini]